MKKEATKRINNLISLYHLSGMELASNISVVPTTSKLLEHSLLPKRKANVKDDFYQIGTENKFDSGNNHAF